MPLANLNGKLLPADALVLKASNSALRYGFGLFETMLLQEGQIMLANYHWERLFEGLRKLEFNIPAYFTSAYLQEEMLKTVRKNDFEKLCRIRLQVFTDIEGFFTQEQKLPGFLIECFTTEKSTIGWNENGWISGIAQGMYKNNDNFANLKSCNALPYVIAAQQARVHGWDDALILNHQSHIIESTIANIFWVKDEQLYTPPLSEGCIAGVMRRHLMNECRKLDISIQETLLTFELLKDADEVFLTNAIRRMKWVKQIQATAYKHSFTRDLYKQLSFDL